MGKIERYVSKKIFFKFMHKTKVKKEDFSWDLATIYETN